MQTLQISPDGFFFKNGEPLPDKEMGKTLLKTLSLDTKGQFISSLDGENFLIECFDQPLIIDDLVFNKSNSSGCPLTLVQKNYEFSTAPNMNEFCLDEWDRLMGRTENGIPFVLTKEAQEQLFDQLDCFDDDSITLFGQNYLTPPWLKSLPEVSQIQYWDHRYQTQDTQWDLNGPSPALAVTLPQLKLPRSRVAVLGCGSGHDAAFWADQGHIVTGYDISEEAIKKAHFKYQQKTNLKFIRSDLFQIIPPENPFDIVFEHTCYCAISPERRTDLVKKWSQLLKDKGLLIGVFFSMDKRQGPPFGGSEWEVQKRLDPYFKILYSQRFHHSTEGRQGKEFILIAEKKHR